MTKAITVADGASTTEKNAAFYKMYDRETENMAIADTNRGNKDQRDSETGERVSSNQPAGSPAAQIAQLERGGALDNGRHNPTEARGARKGTNGRADQTFTKSAKHADHIAQASSHLQLTEFDG